MFYQKYIIYLAACGHTDDMEANPEERLKFDVEFDVELPVLLLQPKLVSKVLSLSSFYQKKANITVKNKNIKISQ